MRSSGVAMLSSTIRTTAFGRWVVERISAVLLECGDAYFHACFLANEFLYVIDAQAFIYQDKQSRLHPIDFLTNTAGKTAIFSARKVSGRLHKILDFIIFHSSDLIVKTTRNHTRMGPVGQVINKQGYRIPTVVGMLWPVVDSQTQVPG